MRQPKATLADLANVPGESSSERVSIDFFPVTTFRVQTLYVFLVLAHDRRRIVYLAVTA